jgi:transposase, IS5 family
MHISISRQANPKRQNEGSNRVWLKLGVSLDKGFARINSFSWDAYLEGGDLIKQVESYKKQHGYYPELVQADKIYTTRENRM